MARCAPWAYPTLRDRAQQALHLLALAPVAETLADRNSYGFRPERATADAICQCHTVLSGHNRAQWVLELNATMTQNVVTYTIEVITDN